MTDTNNTQEADDNVEITPFKPDFQEFETQPGLNPGWFNIAGR